MDELLCTESSIPPGSSDQQTNNHTDNQPTCSYDATIFSDERVLDNLLLAQSLTQPSDQFLQPNKSNVTPNIRAVLVNWMLELCEHRNCEDQVFLVAVNLLDRFLNLVQVHRSQLQLAACSCLLLSSKLRQSSYLSVDILAYYTEDSVTSQEIIQWEQLILAKLSWNVSPVISYDFIEHLLQLLPRDANFDRIRSHSYTYITLAATDNAFISRPPSWIAAAAVVSAMDGVTSRAFQSASLERMATLLRCDISTQISPTRTSLEVAIQRYLQQVNNLNNNNEEVPDHHFLGGKEQTLETYNKIDGKVTPTDITDVHL